MKLVVLALSLFAVSKRRLSFLLTKLTVHCLPCGLFLTSLSLLITFTHQISDQVASHNHVRKPHHKRRHLADGSLWKDEAKKFERPKLWENLKIVDEVGVLAKGAKKDDEPE